MLQKLSQLSYLSQQQHTKGPFGRVDENSKILWGQAVGLIANHLRVES